MLQPCEQCRRHIDARDAVCPFCAVPTAEPQPRALLASRVGRAVVFASATLISCDQGKPATEPPQGSASTLPAATWRVRGTIMDARTNAPLANVQVSLTRTDNPQGSVLTATTDAKGRYTIEDASQGEYRLAFSYSVGSEQAYDMRTITLTRGDSQVVDATLYPSAPAMPYGAPPARRRAV